VRFKLRRLRRVQQPSEVVLGREMAQAVGAEQRHRSGADGKPSPLDGVAYDVTTGALDMHRFVESPVDQFLSALVIAAREMSPDEVAGVRSALRMTDLYTLLAFVRRCALASVSGRPSPSVHEGVLALVLVVQTRVDWRDLADAAELLAWALSKAGLDHGAELRAASAALRIGLEPAVESVAGRAANQLEPSQRLVQTPLGPAFADTYFERYEPTVDLVGLAFAVQDVVEADAYHVRGLTVETDLPDVWLTSSDGLDSSRALEGVVAGVTLNCALSPTLSDAADKQQLSVFLVEAADDESASILAAAAVSTESHEAIGVAIGRTCCIIVARSFVAGVTPYEPPGALARFAVPLHSALAA
jgi:hypothetical protein